MQCFIVVSAKLMWVPVCTALTLHFCDLQHAAVKQCIEGEPAGLDSLPTLVDAAAVSKVTHGCGLHWFHIIVAMSLVIALQSIWCAQHYKVAPGELKIGTLTDAITSRIATSEC